MNDIKKDLNYANTQINLALYMLFVGIWIITLGDYYFFNSTQNSLLTVAGLTVISLVTALSIIPGIKRFNRNRKYFEIKGKLPKKIYLAVIPNVLGFAIMGISVFLMSFFSPISGGVQASTQYWHPYNLQAGILFFVGSGIVALSVLLYRAVIPKILRNNEYA